ncbi:hypothetical protein [Nocardioides lijunqiniae]|uniref:hypothetical protein n=1 Tax=Nocardioides lijunqiniae TaxID=2760832 RepID=UPI001878044D|nr:hypothetical protein [Nocardioides lijunqiniae]
MSPDGRRSRWSRWAGARDEVAGSTAQQAEPPLDDDLVQDVVAMTRQAAVDGLPLSAVLEDLRLVLDLAPGADLPAQVLRACALAWASVQQDLAAGSAGDVAVRTWHELESHLWGSVGLGEGPDPTWLVEVRAGAPRPAEAGESALASVLGPVDHLRGAAQVLASYLVRPGEQVSLLRPPTGQEPDRVLALVVSGPDEERPELARARLQAQPIGGEGALDVRVVALTGHPDGMLAALREAVERRD